MGVAEDNETEIQAAKSGVDKSNPNERWRERSWKKKKSDELAADAESDKGLTQQWALFRKAPP